MTNPAEIIEADGTPLTHYGAVEHQPMPSTSVAVADRMLEIAVQRGANLDELDKFLDMKMRYERDEARKAYAQAMADFRADVPAIIKNKEGHNNEYATLDNICGKINPFLAKHGLTFMWELEQSDKVTVRCVVTHKQGHSQTVTLSGPPDTSGSKNAIQAIASTVTYLHRYTLLSAFGLAATDRNEDDGSGPPKAYERITDEQALSIHAFIDEHGFDRKAFDDWMKRVLSVSSIEEIPAPRYADVMRTLNKRAEQK